MVTVNPNIPVICYGLRSDFFPQRLPRLHSAAGAGPHHRGDEDHLHLRPQGTCNCRKVNGQFVFEGEQVAIDPENDVQYVSILPPVLLPGAARLLRPPRRKISGLAFLFGLFMKILFVLSVSLCVGNALFVSFPQGDISVVSNFARFLRY